MRKTLLVALLLAVANAVSAQLPVWVCPPKYVQGGTPINLPLGPGSNDPQDPYDYYDGWSAKQGANGMIASNGSLRFFIIDGAIYKSDGAYADYAWNSSQPNILISGNVYQPEGDGGSEIVILPHPVNCNQYYIFGICTQWSGDITKSLPGYTMTLPMYCLYDAQLGQVILRGSWYSPYPTYMATAPQSNPIFTSVSTANPANTNGDSQVTTSVWGEDVAFGTASLSASDKQSDGSYYISCKMRRNFYFIKLESTGTLRYWKRYLHSMTMGGYPVRCESELVYDNSSGKFKFAFGNLPVNPSSQYGAYSIEYYELSPNLLTTTVHHTFEIPNINQGPNDPNIIRAVHGVEFSPNKRYLYFTSSDDPVSLTARLHYVDLSLATPTVVDYTLSSTVSTAIKNANIELSGDSKMYFASATGLYSLSGSDNPGTSTFSNTAAIGFTYASNKGINANGSNFVSNDYLVAFTLPDQVDGMNYTSHFTATSECCKLTNTYDKNSYTNTASGTWSIGLANNPIQTGAGSTFVTIRDELRIKKGTTVTINNMTIKFAANARLVVEAGDASTNGGKLILNNCYLTLETSCGTDLLWNGIQVQGIGSENQGSFNGNSKQGRLSMNSTTVEYARRGVSNNLYVHNPQFPLLNFGSGGAIVQITNSTLKDNERGVVLANYYAPSGAGDQSRIRNTVFKTTNLIPEVDIPIAHIQLSRVKGIQINGNDFKNEVPSSFALAQRGNGIMSGRSSFFVTPICSNIGCTIYDPNKFENLYYGIQTNSSNGTLTFTSDKSTFKDNVIGIRAEATILPKIIRNTFDVLQVANTQTFGLYMNGCNKYKVEENLFKVLNPSFQNDLSYGVLVKSSGVEPNEIYKNTFTDLWIGGQVEGVNRAVGNQLGLVWKCNLFRVRKYDITNINGTMSGNQGYFDNSSVTAAQQKAANNTFSQASEAMSLEHDFKLVNSANFKYVHTSEALMTPDSYTTPNLVLPVQALNGVTPVSYSATVGCPSKIGHPIIILKNWETAAQVKINDNLATIDGGDTPYSLNFTETEDLADVKDHLIANSPLVTDVVLEAYLNRHPDEADIEDVIIANSPVSPEMMDLVEGMNLSNQTMRDIGDAQTGYSHIQAVYDEINYNTEILHYAIDEQLSYYLLDTVADPSDTTGGPSDTSFTNKLNGRNEAIYKYILIDHLIQKGLTTQAQNLLSTVENYGRTEEICQLQIATNGVSDLETYYLANTDVWDLGLGIYQDNTANENAVQARYLLFDQMNSSEPCFALTGTGAKSLSSDGSQNDAENSSTINLFSLFPNPAEKTLTIQKAEFVDDASITIYSINGIVLFEGKLNESSQNIDISFLSNGIFIVQVQDLTSGKIDVERLVKQ